MRGDEQPVRLIGALFQDHPEPEGLEAPAAALASDADPLDGEFFAGEPDRLALPGAAVAEPEGEIDESDVEAEKPDDRPGAGGDESRSPPPG